MASVATKSLRVRAAAFGARLDLRALGGERLGPSVAIVRTEGTGFAFAFRFGCLVSFGLDGEQGERVERRVAALVGEPFKLPETEVIDLIVDPSLLEGPHDGYVVVADLSEPRLLIVAEALAKSVAMAQYEAAVGEAFGRIEPLARQLAVAGKTHRRSRELLRQLGEALLVEQRMVARVQTTEKPELLWEHVELERLYLLLEEEFELKERNLALERKLALLTRSARTCLDLLQAERSLRVEWYVVALILLELGISVYDLVFRAH